MDASDCAIFAVTHRWVDGVLAPISYESHLLTMTERKYSTYKKECLAIIFGCAKCHTCLEHKEFEFCCDNLALCWLLKRAEDVGHLGRFILQLVPLKFRVKNIVEWIML
jgi:hypothetical protein